jgi:outer membrane lipoprotein LolB
VTVAPRRIESVRAALILLALAVGLTACAGPQRRAAAPERDNERDRRAAALEAWQLEGRIAVAGEGSGRLRWEQDGAFFRLEVRAPVSGETWRLSGDAEQSQIEGIGPEPVRGLDAEALLERETGWHIPLEEARFWVRGLAADTSRARVEHDASGRPRALRENGWQVEYRAWLDAGGLSLPARIVARRGKREIRVAISAWRIDDGA